MKWILKVVQTETGCLFWNVTNKCAPVWECSTCLTYVRNNSCVKQEMETDGFWHGGRWTKTTGFAEGICFYQPIADSTWLMLTLIDRTGSGYQVQPFCFLFWFVFVKLICISSFKHSEARFTSSQLRKTFTQENTLLKNWKPKENQIINLL